MIQIFVDPTAQADAETWFRDQAITHGSPMHVTHVPHGECLCYGANDDPHAWPTIAEYAKEQAWFRGATFTPFPSPQRAKTHGA